MKKLILILSFFMSFSSMAQINMSIVKSYDGKKRLQLSNTDTRFTYKLKVYNKDLIITTFSLQPNQNQVVDFQIKNKKTAKNMTVAWSYDEETRNIDKSQQLIKSESYERYANNIESECWTETRKKGWQLALMGLLYGNGRLIDALKEIVTSQYMGADNIKYQITLTRERLEYQYLGSGERSWLREVLDYYKDLLAALETPFSMCPELKNKQQQYWQTAKSLREDVIIFDRKLEQEKYQVIKKEVWKYASNLQLLTPAFTGLGVEVNYQSITNEPALEDGKANNNLAIVYDKNSNNFKPEVKMQIPLSKPFMGMMYHLPARLYFTTTVGQGAFSYTSDDKSVFLGINNRSKEGSIDYAIGALGGLKMQYTYAGLGLKYLFIPGNNMWLSWEIGAMTILENSLTITGEDNYEVTNNLLVKKSQISSNNERKIFSENKVNPYLRIQYSVALFSVGGRSKYPDRKKVALGVGLGIMGLNTDINSTSHRLLLIETNQNKVTKSTIIRPSDRILSLNAGLYLYL
jgi:hypothetical protein